MTIALALLLAAAGGAMVGYSVASVVTMAEISDLERDNAEQRSQLNAWQHKETKS